MAFIFVFYDYLSVSYNPYSFSLNQVIAHEWAHYRWGIFDEYPRPGASNFYAAYNGKYEATRCTTAVPGKILVTPLPLKICDGFLTEL